MGKSKRRTIDHLLTRDGTLNLRGSYIIDQALAVAIATMTASEHPAYSDVEDMKALQGLFMRAACARKLEKASLAVERKRAKAVA